MNPYLLSTLVVFLVSTLVVHLLIPSLRTFAFKKSYTVLPRDKNIDIPQAIRKASHSYHIPLTGGLAIVAAIITGLLVSALLFTNLMFVGDRVVHFAVLLFSSLLIGAMGFADDARRLSYLFRLVAAAVMMLMLLFFTVYGEVFLLPGEVVWQIGTLELIVLLIWCLGLSNAINLIDGLDGSASGIIAIAAIWIGLITTTEAFLVTTVLTGILAATVAFLAYNFHPAQIFLGSTGTLFLGFALAIITVWPPNPQTPNYFFPYAVLVFAVPLADMALVFFIRILHGKNPFVADSWHIHDRVLLTGASRKQASLAIWALSFCCGGIAYLSFRSLIPYLIAVGIVALLLGGFYLVVASLQKQSRPVKTKGYC